MLQQIVPFKVLFFGSGSTIVRSFWKCLQFWHHETSVECMVIQDVVSYNITNFHFLYACCRHCANKTSRWPVLFNSTYELNSIEIYREQAGTGELTGTSFKSLLLSVDEMIALNDILSNPANFTPPTRASLFYAARCNTEVAIAYVMKSVEFLSECGRANASSPRVLSRMS